MSTINIATVTPVYAGREFLAELLERIETLRENWRAAGAPMALAEAIFVNDASDDGSLELLYELQADRPWLRVVNLSRNFGQHPATVAGVLHTSSDWVVTLDEDLQHDPAMIDRLLRQAVQGQRDVLYASPEHRVHENAFRDWGSSAFKALTARVTGNPHVRRFNSFRLMRGSIARAAASVCSHGTYFDIALCWFTDRIASLPLPLKDRRFKATGASGYTVRKLFSHARRLAVSSDVKVLRLGALIGLVAVTLAVVLGARILLLKYLEPNSIEVAGWASLFLTVVFFGGLICILLGIVLEYISLMVLHIQGKPTYFVVDRQSDRLLIEHYRRRSPHDSVPEPVEHA